MSRAAAVHGTSSRGSLVRFQDDLQKAPSSPRPTAVAAAAAAAPAPAPTNLDVRLGLLLVGGIYATDLLLLEAPAVGTTEPHPQPQPQPLPLQVRGLAVSNLSVGLEPRAAAPPDAAPSTSQQQHAVVLRLWADREGPFDALFTLALPPDQQELEVHVSATIFHRSKGTPGLKPHVRCLGFAADADTEGASDWQGF